MAGAMSTGQGQEKDRERAGRPAGIADQAGRQIKKTQSGVCVCVFWPPQGLDNVTDTCWGAIYVGHLSDKGC